MFELEGGERRRELHTDLMDRSLLRRSWLIVASTLASLLSVSLLVHVLRGCRGPASAHLPERRDYSYVPLSDINGAAPRGGGDVGKSRGSDESDSQDEMWSL